MSVSFLYSFHLDYIKAYCIFLQKICDVFQKELIQIHHVHLRVLFFRLNKMLRLHCLFGIAHWFLSNVACPFIGDPMVEEAALL